jgi:hypothetical protein
MVIAVPYFDLGWSRILILAVLDFRFWVEQRFSAALRTALPCGFSR